MRRAGRVLEELHEGRSAGGAIVPELPSRRDHSRRRRGLGATPKGGKRCGKSRPFAGRPSGGWRGVAPSPILRANAEHGEEDEVPEGQRGQGLSSMTVSAGNGKRSGKRGVLSFCRQMLTPKAAQRAKKAVPASPCPQPSYRRDRTVTRAFPVVPDETRHGRCGMQSDTANLMPFVRSPNINDITTSEDGPAGRCADRRSAFQAYAPRCRPEVGVP